MAPISSVLNYAGLLSVGLYWFSFGDKYLDDMNGAEQIGCCRKGLSIFYEMSHLLKDQTSLFSWNVP